MNVLSIYSCATRVNFQLLDMPSETVIAKGHVLRIGISGSCINYHDIHTGYHHASYSINSHCDALKAIRDMLQYSDTSADAIRHSVSVIAHFISHGGTEGLGPVIISEASKDIVRKNIVLSDYRNIPALQGIEAAEHVFPDAVQVGVFDTSFAQTMEPKAYRYAVAPEYYDMGVRKYGSHGITHEHVLETACLQLKLPVEKQRMVICDIGTEVSICAVSCGHCIDVSSGFSPLEGPVMSANCGACDAHVIEYIVRMSGKTLPEVMNTLNRQSGIMALCDCLGHTEDMKYLLEHNDERAKLAVDMQVYSIQKYIGAYVAALQGIDVLAFTGMHGVTNPMLRKAIASAFTYLGLELDEDINSSYQWQEQTATDISGKQSKVKVIIVHKQDEVALAMAAYKLCQRNHRN